MDILLLPCYTESAAKAKGAAAVQLFLFLTHTQGPDSSPLPAIRAKIHAGIY